MIHTPDQPLTEKPLPATSPLEAIRLYTRGLHDRVEASVDLKSCLTSRVSYAALLSRYLALYDPFENLLASLTGRSAALAATLNRPKAHLLRLDLQTLNHEASQPSTPPPFPNLNHPDSLLGALYVVEGSSLGGRYIAREVLQTLALDATSGAAFFSGDGEATGTLWKRFTETLNQEVADPALAATSACAMFKAFEVCLSESRLTVPPKDPR